MKSKKTPKPRPTSFTQLFKQKRLVENLDKRYNKERLAFNEMLRNSRHLSNRVTTYNKSKVYVKVEIPFRDWETPSLIIEPIKGQNL